MRRISKLVHDVPKILFPRNSFHLRDVSYRLLPLRRDDRNDAAQKCLSTSPRSACEPIESAFSVRIGGGYFVRRTSERDDFSSNRQPAVSFCFSMTSFGKLAPTFPGHALITNIPIGCCCRGFGAATHDVCVIVFHEIQESHFSRVRSRRILPLDVTAYGVDVLS